MMRNSGKPEFRCKSGCLRLAALNDAELGQARVPMQVGLSPTCGIHCCETRASPNTVHLSTLMAFLMLTGGGGLFVRRRSGKLLILRLTPRGLRRLRLETTRSWRISSSTASCKARLCRGGNGRETRELAADDADCMQ